MSQVKITQPGFEKFSGTLGEVTFKEGISEGPVSKIQAQRIRASMKIETLAGDDPGITAQIARARAHQPEPVVYKEPEAKVAKREYDFTEESLMTVADKGGLSGLREFAKPYGVTAKSIPLLIERLIALKEGV